MLRGLKEYVAAPKKERASGADCRSRGRRHCHRRRRQFRPPPPRISRPSSRRHSQLHGRALQDEHLLGQLFQYRFPTGRGLARPQLRKSLSHRARRTSPEIFPKQFGLRAGARHSRPHFSVHRAKRHARSRTRRRHYRLRRNENFALQRNRFAACAWCRAASVRFRKFSTLSAPPISSSSARVRSTPASFPIFWSKSRGSHRAFARDVRLHRESDDSAGRNASTTPLPTTSARFMNIPSAPFRLRGHQPEARFRPMLRRYRAQGAEPVRTRIRRTQTHGPAPASPAICCRRRGVSPRSARLAGSFSTNSLKPSARA